MKRSMMLWPSAEYDKIQERHRYYPEGKGDSAELAKIPGTWRRPAQRNATKYHKMPQNHILTQQNATKHHKTQQPTQYSTQMTKRHKTPQNATKCQVETCFLGCVECCGVLCAGPLYLCERGGESFLPLSSRKWGAIFFKSPPSPPKKTVSGFFQLRKQTSKKRPFIIHVAHPSLYLVWCNSKSGPAFTQKS